MLKLILCVFVVVRLILILILCIHILVIVMLVDLVMFGFVIMFASLDLGVHIDSISLGVWIFLSFHHLVVAAIHRNFNLKILLLILENCDSLSVSS